MAVKKYKPVTPGMRDMTGYTFEEITKSTPERSLLVMRQGRGGRNAQGRVTVRHRGGGARRFIRLVDFKREKHGIPAKVAAVEYDPNRTARLALLFYVDGEKRYIIAPLDLKVGDTVMSGPAAEIRPGNSLPISNIPIGTLIHNIEMKEGKGAQLVRSAGGGAGGDRPDPARGNPAHGREAAQPVVATARSSRNVRVPRAVRRGARALPGEAHPSLERDPTRRWGGQRAAEVYSLRRPVRCRRVRSEVQR